MKSITSVIIITALFCAPLAKAAFGLENTVTSRYTTVAADAALDRITNLVDTVIVDDTTNTAANGVIDLGSLSPANYTAVSNAAMGAVQGSSDSYITVRRGSTAEESWGALTNAYASAKLLTPGGVSLSISNRVVVVLPSGTYAAGTNSLYLDTDYIDLVAQHPQTPQTPTNIVAGQLSQEEYIPTGTLLEGVGDTVVIQSASNVRLIGFSIANIHKYEAEAALRLNLPFKVVDFNGAEESFYEKIYLYASNYQITDTTVPTHNPMFIKDVGGTWVDCVGHDWCWRINYTAEYDTTFKADMYRCFAGYRSFGGDWYTGFSTNEHKFADCYLYQCVATTHGFGGCGTWGIPHDSTAIFVECENGDNGFGLGSIAGGRYIRCVAGYNNFGGTAATSNENLNGTFSGYAEDCVAKAGSFGGTDWAMYATGSRGTNSGIMIGCTIGELNQSGGVGMLLKGATIDDCHITGGTGDGAGIPTLTLLDNDTVIRNSTILNMAGDTNGAPISASTNRNVVAVNTTFNNGVLFPEGIDFLVSNTALQPNNIVIDSSFELARKGWDIYVHPDPTLSPGECGELLKAAVDYAEAIWDETCFTEKIRIILDDAIYEVTNGVDVTVPIRFEAALPPHGGYAAQHDLSPQTLPLPQAQYTYGTWIRGVGAGSLIRYGVWEGASTVSFSGFYLLGDIEVTAINAATFIKIDRCLVQGDVGLGLDTETSISINDSIIDGQIGEGNGYFKGFQAVDSIFTTNSTIAVIKINAGFDGPQTATALRRCRIENPAFFQQNETFLVTGFDLYNCSITGNGFGSSLPDYTFSMNFYYCSFYDTAGTWMPNVTAGQQGNIKFFHCTGVSTTVTSTVAKVLFCSDQNDAAITNQ